MKKILFVFGTRPEAIKMAPLVQEFARYKVDIKICVTGQHREMLDQVLDFFSIIPDYDLNLMRPGQDLSSLTAKVLTGIQPVLTEFNPDFVLVHGDTTTSFSASLASFYAGIKVCHVEAGLRTNNKFSPFPEEINRVLTGRIADIHFAPTSTAKKNLMFEGIKEDSILVTGNTVIDALLISIEKLKKQQNEEIKLLESLIKEDKRIILVTGHRRENFGDGFLRICLGLRKIADNHPDIQIIYPVHLYPNVKAPVFEMLSLVPNISLIEPLSYESFIWLMNKAYLVITDSGGIQEEAPSLGKPVLVMRDTTERPEAVQTGTVLLVGTDADRIYSEAHKLIVDEQKYKTMSELHNPYGDGTASKRIVDYILNNVKNEYK